MRAEFEVVVVFLEFDNLAIARVEFTVGQTIFLRQKSLLLCGIEACVASLIKLSGIIEFG